MPQGDRIQSVDQCSETAQISVWRPTHPESPAHTEEQGRLLQIDMKPRIKTWKMQRSRGTGGETSMCLDCYCVQSCIECTHRGSKSVPTAYSAACWRRCRTECSDAWIIHGCRQVPNVKNTKLKNWKMCFARVLFFYEKIKSSRLLNSWVHEQSQGHFFYTNLHRVKIHIKFS